MRFQLYLQTCLTITYRNDRFQLLQGFSDFVSSSVGFYISTPSKIGLIKKMILEDPSLERAIFFCQNKVIETTLRHEMNVSGNAFCGEIINMVENPFSLDPVTYESAISMTNKVIDKELTQARFHASTFAEDVLDEIPFAIADTLANKIKLALEIERETKLRGIKTFIMLSNNKSDLFLSRYLLKSKILGRIVLPKDSVKSWRVNDLAQSYQHPIREISGETFPNVDQAENIIALNELENAHHLLIGNFADKQYMESVYPVWHGLGPQKVALLSTSPRRESNTPSDIVDETDFWCGCRILLKNIRKIPRYLNYLHDVKLHNFTGLNDSLTEIQHYIYLHALNEIPKKFLYGISFCESFFPYLNKTNLKNIVACSGRTFETRLILRYAKRIGIPTFDLQAGTISNSVRFFPALADNILCFDRASYNIYTNKLLCDPLKVSAVGSIRLDANLAKVREYAAQKKLLTVEHIGKKLLFIGQPLGDRISGELMKILIGSNLDGWDVVLKPHPRETEQDLAKYHKCREAMINRGAHIVIDTETSIYEMLPTCNIICTYFSTVAIEAFGLGKMICILDPFEAAPDLDLVKSGIGLKVETSLQLDHILQSKNHMHKTYDKMLTVLQDGLTLERVLSAVSQ